MRLSPKVVTPSQILFAVAFLAANTAHAQTSHGAGGTAAGAGFANSPEDIEGFKYDCFSGEKIGLPRMGIINGCKAVANAPGMDTEIVAQAYNQIGSSLFADSNYEKAIENFDAALRVIPDYNWALNNKALSFLRLNRCEDSYNLYKYHAEKDPDNFEAFYGEASALLCLKRLPEALTAITAAVQNAPHRHLYYQTRGRLYLAAGENKKAMEDIDGYARLNRVESTANYFAAVFALGANDFAAAKKYAGKYNAAVPGDNYNTLLMHIIALREGRSEGEMLTKVASAIQDQNSFMANLLRLALGTATPDQVNQSIQAAKPEVQKSHLLDFHYYYGEKLLAQGDRQSAKAEFQETVNLDLSTYQEHWNALARLRELEKPPGQQH